MFKRLVLFLIALVVCPLIVAAQDEPPREIFTVLDYGDPIFERDMWRVAGAEEANTYTSVTWRYKPDEQILFFFLYLHFDGGATEEAVSDYFSGENLEALLVNYEPWRQTDNCTLGDVTIYEFVSKLGQERRVLRYWVQTITPTRVLAVNAAVPEAQLDLIEEYAASLFPNAVSCRADE